MHTFLSVAGRRVSRAPFWSPTGHIQVDAPPPGPTLVTIIILETMAKKPCKGLGLLTASKHFSWIPSVQGNARRAAVKKKKIGIALVFKP